MIETVVCSRRSQASVGVLAGERGKTEGLSPIGREAILSLLSWHCCSGSSSALEGQMSLAPCLAAAEAGCQWKCRRKGRLDPWRSGSVAVWRAQHVGLPVKHHFAHCLGWAACAVSPGRTFIRILPSTIPVIKHLLTCPCDIQFLVPVYS